MSDADKRQNGYRLAGQHDGMFLCDDCHGATDEYDIDRRHIPLQPVTCLACGETVVSGGAT